MPILEPRQTWQIIPAQQIAGVLEQRVLMVGQMLAAGTATAGELYQNLTNDDSVNNTLFGRRSHLAGMVREFKNLNQIVPLDVIPLDDATGTAGTAVITITGVDAGEDADLVVTVGSEKRHSKTINVLEEDTPTEIGDAIVAAFDADLDCPFQAANVTGTVTFTCEHDGTMCNDWSIKVEGTVADITIALTGWSGGATDPTLTGVLDAINDIRYQTIVWPSPYALTEVQDLLDARFNTANMILDGMAVQVKKGTLASLKTYADQNSENVLLMGNKTVNEADRIGTATMEMPDIVASEFAAFKSLRLTTDAPLARYLSTVAPNDQFGGIELASLPYFNTLMPNLPVADPRDEFAIDEQVELTANGVGVFGPNRVFNATILGQLVMTYLTNPAGNPDNSFKYPEVVETASVIREFMYENCRSRYAQTRLTEGDLVAGRDMANEASIRAFLNELYDELAEATLVQAGTAAKKDFNDNLVITLIISTGTVTINMAPLLVTQMRAILGTIQINFGS